MRLNIHAAIAIAIGIATPAQAFTGKDLSAAYRACEQKITNKKDRFSYTKCMEDEVPRLDARVEAEYRKLIKRKDEAPKAFYDKAHEAWKGYRDANCEARAYEFHYAEGDGATNELFMCYIEHDLQRLKEIRYIDSLY